MALRVHRELGEIEHFNWCFGQPNNIAVAVRIRGGLRPDALRAALDKAQQRHPLLRVSTELPASANVDNLDVFPPRGLDTLVDAVNRHAIRDVVLTGTISDPQLYRHEERLVALLRARLHADARLSLHTNGVLALRKMHVLDQYDRACISFPSFVPDTYEQMMASRRVPDLARIVATARIPVKVSCVVDDPNEHERDAFLAECARLGVKRLVFRKLYGERRIRPLPATLAARTPVRSFKGNPVYDVDGMEVTVWAFDDSECRSVNLFPDGTLGTSYLLTRTVELRATMAR